MRIGRIILSIAGSLFLSSYFAAAQSIIDPPPIDPGALIGVPSPEPPPPLPNTPDENIPVAEPVEEVIPVAEPVIEPSPAQRAQQQQSPETPSLPDNSLLPVEQNQTQIAILGYHDFSEINPPTEMRMRTSVFRQQMLALKNSKIPVISMKEFMEWKKGQRTLPPYCVMITIDDGWKSVYTDAYPVLREMGFPFTMFLYTHFVTGQGSSIGIPQVKEMMLHGATVGSHSTRHLYPSAWKRSQRKGAEDYKRTIEQEIRDSRAWLQNNFGTSIDTYCYPGGYHTPEMIAALPEYGYSFAFTVIPRKVLHNTDNWEVPRYMVFGNNPQTFKRAVTFTKAPVPGSFDSEGGNGINSALPVPVQKVEPPANSSTTSNMPNISIELTNGQDILTDSLEMRVTGFGKVPAKIVPNTTTFLWQPNRPFRTDVVRVKVRWKSASTGAKESVEWEFGVKAETANMLPANLVR